MAGGLIGTIQLDDPLYWVTEKKPTVLGVEKRDLDGKVIQSWVQSGSQIDEQHLFRFTWVTYAQLEQIKSLIRSRATFSIKVTPTAATMGSCRFVRDEPLTYKPVVPEEFFSPEDVKGKDLDLYDGEIKVWIRR